MKKDPFLFYLKDTGIIPNSVLPLVIYQQVFNDRGLTGATWLENRFAENGWLKAWRDSVFPYTHYHSITHEVLGVYQGKSLLQFGGDDGESISVRAGDIVVIPAGVAHKKLQEKDEFRVVGSYPNGMDYDIKTVAHDEYEEALINIPKVPLPHNDPIFGPLNGIRKFWKENG